MLPPLVETCHCTVGVGDPDAEALNCAREPAATESFEGCLVIFGAARPDRACRFPGGVNLWGVKPMTRFVKMSPGWLPEAPWPSGADGDAPATCESPRMLPTTKAMPSRPAARHEPLRDPSDLLLDMFPSVRWPYRRAVPPNPSGQS